MRLIFRLLFYSIVFISIVVLLPGNILLDIECKQFNYLLSEQLAVDMQSNEKLSTKTKLFQNELFGPESLAHFNGKLVTGSSDGFFATNIYNTTKCGRSLGLRFDSKGTLFVIEPNIGVFSVHNIFDNKPEVELVFDIKIGKDI